MSIEKMSRIDKSNLSGEFYVTSLLDEAQRKNLLTEQQVQHLQLSYMELLAKHTLEYTKGSSSSVPLAAAENIMKSDLYTIGLGLKMVGSPDDALDALLSSPALTLYQNGREALKNKLTATKYAHIRVVSTMLDTPNEAYKSTLAGGIKGFFKCYEPNFGAHEVPITVDYPLCQPVRDLAGVEFIQQYLSRALWENQFCSCFSKHDIHALLRGYHEDYEGLIFNLFEQVLTCALSCVLTGGEARSLQLSKERVAVLAARFEGQSAAQVALSLQEACKTLLTQLGLTGRLQTEYVCEAVPKIAAGVVSALSVGQPALVFILPREEEHTHEIYFSMGAKMGDEQYRSVVAQVQECERAADKVDIIHEQVKSLSDLEDLIFDARLQKEELPLLFHAMRIEEVAVLAKNYDRLIEAEAGDMGLSELDVQTALKQYIMQLTQEQQEWIARWTKNLICTP